MIEEHRFFHDFFDGQIVGEESEKYKLFKVMLVSCFSALGLFLVFSGVCSWTVFALLEVGMIWNVYSNIKDNISFFLCIFVAVFYFYFAVQMKVYANGLIYIAAYIPLQMMAISKDYSEGSFVQIKKKITDYNKVLFVMFFVALFVTLSLFNFGVAGRYSIYDGLSASLLVCSAVLRNERYFEYYVFRIFALVMTISLWIILLVRYGNYELIAIVLMYGSYLIFDVVTYFYQNKTYINQYMIEVEKHKKREEEKVIKSKLKAYKETKND